MSSSSGAFLGLLKERLSKYGPVPDKVDSEGTVFNAVSILENIPEVPDNSMKSSRSSRIPRPPQAIVDECLQSIRRTIVERKKSALSKSEDFDELYRSISSKDTIDYDEFRAFMEKAPESMKRFFSAEYFLMFPKDKDGAISSEWFLRFVQRTLDVENVSLQLLAHAKESSAGFINEQELERFILERIPHMNACGDLPESFYPYYVFTASRRFLFFLDPRRNRRISIKKLAHSAVMEELLFLQRISQQVGFVDPRTLKTQVDSNWFSGSNAMRVFSLYVDLDRDQNGMLSQEELMAFTGPPNDNVQLTETAVRRIFEENITYSPMEMDYKTFLDLYLALEYKTTIESMTYFWRILDLDRCGKLTSTAIKYFYSDVYESLRKTGYEAPAFENVLVEIYDILGVQTDPTLQDLIASDQGHTVISMLLDVSGFWQYDNRESLMQQQNVANPPDDDNDGDYEAYEYDFDQTEGQES